MKLNSPYAYKLGLGAGPGFSACTNGYRLLRYTLYSYKACMYRDDAPSASLWADSCSTIHIYHIWHQITERARWIGKIAIVHRPASNNPLKLPC